MRKLLLAEICCFVLGGCVTYTEPNTTKPIKETAPILTEELVPTKELANTPIPTSAQTPQPLPTNTTTPKPTATPKPTENSKPTSTPIPTKTTSLQNTDPTLIHSFSGEGDDVIFDVYIESCSFVKFTCKDDRYKCVKAHHGDDYELLVNDSDPYVGSTFLEDCYDTNVMFEINATGKWTLEVYSLGFSEYDSFSGIGDYVTPIFKPSSKVYEINCPSNRYFCVKGYYGNFDYDLLVNESEPYKGKVLFKPYGDYAFFTIESHGEWSINPVN